MIFKFIKLIPSFFRLFCDYEMKPEDIRFSLEQYTIVINRLTGGRMSKVNYYADDIVSVVNDIYCDGCEYRTVIGMKFHISAYIDDLLAMNDEKLTEICACGKDENGNHPGVRELRAYLLKEKALGHRFVPSEGCDNFDPVKGCMGHDS